MAASPPAVEPPRWMSAIAIRLWVLLACLFLAFGWRELQSGDKAFALPALLLVVFFLVLGSLTRHGVFANHRGGWPTYVGLFVAFFAIFFVGAALADAFWGTPPPRSVWFMVSFMCMVAGSALLVGARRHRDALLLSHSSASPTIS
jgi:hypothetical protein